MSSGENKNKKLYAQFRISPFVCLFVWLLFVGGGEGRGWGLRWGGVGAMEILVESEVTLGRWISQCNITAMMNTQNYVMRKFQRRVGAHLLCWVSRLIALILEHIFYQRPPSKAVEMWCDTNDISAQLKITWERWVLQCKTGTLMNTQNDIGPFQRIQDALFIFIFIFYILLETLKKRMHVK